MFELGYIITLLNISHHYMKAKQFLQVIKCLFGKLQNINIACTGFYVGCAWLFCSFVLV